jgi:hypothetical protein
MSLSRLHRLVLFSTLGLLLLLASAPSVSASSPNHTEQGLPSSTCPGITLFTPGSGPVGTSVTITGCGFTRATHVTFNSVAASFTVNSNTQITATVPGGATSGAISVRTPTRTVTSTSPFMVTPAVTLSPTVGPPTSTVGVSGTTFGSTEAVDVYFDTIDEALAATTVQGAFAIRIQVPGAAVPGTHWVTAVGRHSGLSAQAAFLVQTDWAQFHNNSRRTGSNPYENVLSPANVANLDVDWSAATGDIVFSSPAVANGVVYVGSFDRRLYAFNAQTGAQMWSATTGAGVASSPAVANGVVYVGSEDDHLYAFNAQTGAQLWSATTGALIDSSPAVANGVVYVGSNDHHLYAFNAQTGGQLWAATTGALIFSSPAVANGVVYVGSFDHHLYAFNAQTGGQLWAAATGSVIYSSPAVANGVVYVGSVDDHLYAFNAQTGVQLWAATTGAENDSSPAVANGVVYIGSGDHHLYAYALPAGAQLKPAARPNPAGLHPNLKLRIGS